MGHLRRKQNRRPEALTYYLEAARGLPTSPYDQNNVETMLRALTLRGHPLNTRRIRVGAACCLFQVVAGIGFHWGAWATYSAAVFLAVAVEATLTVLAPYMLYLYAPLRQLNPVTKKAMFDVAWRERRIGLKHPLTGGLDALFLNLHRLLCAVCGMRACGRSTFGNMGKNKPPMQTTPRTADPTHILVEQARLLNQTERPKQALPLLLQAFAITPDDDQVLCHLSYTYSKLQDNKNALRFAEQAIAQKPDNEWAHRLRGHVFWVKNNYKEAMRCAQEAQKADPDEPQGRRLEADLWLAQRKYKEARTAAETMRNLAPSDAQPFILLARAEMGLAAQNGLRKAPAYRKEAEAFARQALALAPDLPDAHTVLGETLNAQQKTRDALDAFFQASRLDPTAKHTQQNLNSTLFTRFFMLPLFF